MFLFWPDRYDVLLFAVGTAFLLCAPFTKVEESFNLQAAHDVLVHGASIERYDHHEFPGVVPRSFVPPLLLAALAFAPHRAAVALADAWPAARVAARRAGIDVDSRMLAQLAVRGALLWLFVAAFSAFRAAVARRFGRDTSVALALVTACQFHTLFYASRTLPNTFALVVVLRAFAAWLADAHYRTVAWFAVALVLLRAELLVLLAPIVLEAIARGRLPLWSGLLVGFACCAATLLVSTVVDTFMWRHHAFDDWPFAATVARVVPASPASLLFNVHWLPSSSSIAEAFGVSAHASAAAAAALDAVSRTLAAPSTSVAGSLSSFADAALPLASHVPALCVAALDALVDVARRASTTSAAPTWLWPEGYVLFFNTVLNRSAEWGVMPWHWYFSSVLPRALLGAAPLALLGVYYERERLLTFVRPVLLFVAAYSLLPHKELRFVLYAFPVLNLAAACGIARCVRAWSLGGSEKKPVSALERGRQWLFVLGCVGALLASIVAAAALLYISSWNYPGGYAMHALHAHHSVRVVTRPATLEHRPPARVHVAVEACVAGVSRFTESRLGDAQWRYSKTEGATLVANLTFFASFDYLITALPRAGATTTTAADELPLLELMFTPVTDVHAYERLALQPRLPNVSLRLVTQPVLRVWERKVKEQFDDGFTEAGVELLRVQRARQGILHAERLRREADAKAARDGRQAQSSLPPLV